MSQKKVQFNSVTVCWLVLTIIVLVGAGIIAVINFGIGSTFLGDRTFAIWSMLFAAAISCIFGAITSHLVHIEESKEADSMVQRIEGVVTEKTKQLEQERTGLDTAAQQAIMKKLMNRCLDESRGEIKNIRILAHNSSSFSDFFTSDFKDVSFKCSQFEILVYDYTVDVKHKIVKDWMAFNTEGIKNLWIRKVKNIHQKFLPSFFGMVVEFDGHYPMGMIGFYKPRINKPNKPNKNNKDNKSILPLGNCYGVLNEEHSILEVLNEYFRWYWNDKSDEIEKRLFDGGG